MDTNRTRRRCVDLSRILIIDLEATCWQGPPPPGEDHEVIEIGNAVIDSNRRQRRNPCWAQKQE